MAPATALAQAYALWGVLTAFLLAEWIARPYSTWPLLVLQFIVLGAVQGTVYLGSVFAQQGGSFALAGAGAGAALTALIIAMNLGAVLAFLLSLLPALRPAALLQLVGANGDSKVMPRSLAGLAADLLRGGRRKSGGGSSGGSEAGGLRASVVRALDKVAARGAGAGAAARPDLDQGRGDQDPARLSSSPSVAVAGVAPAAASPSAAVGGFSRTGSGAQAAAALGGRRPRSGSGAARAGHAGGSGALGPSEHVGLDMQALGAATSARSLPAHLGAGRTGSEALYAPNGMPLHSFMSVNKWLEESEAGVPGEARGRAPGGLPPSGHGGPSPLRGAASTPAAQPPSIQVGQHHALLQQLQDCREEDLECGGSGNAGSAGADAKLLSGEGSTYGGGSSGANGDEGHGRSERYADSDDELRCRWSRRARRTPPNATAAAVRQPCGGEAGRGAGAVDEGGGGAALGVRSPLAGCSTWCRLHQAGQRGPRCGCADA